MPRLSTIAEVDEEVRSFLTDDDGNLFPEPESVAELEGVVEEPEPPAPVSSLRRISSRFSRLSVATVDSVAPHFVTSNGQKTFQLATFCDLISDCQSLEKASILSVECYKEWSMLGVLHRCLVFHLQRSGRPDVWLRTDRLRASDVSIPGCALNGGKTDANDVARLAGAKQDLLKRPNAKPENRIEFRSPPTLGVFRFCLLIICDELLEYHVWPENCWFLCSLLQQHLFETGSGELVLGKHVHLELAPEIRAHRVSYRLSDPPSEPDLLNALAVESEYIRANIATFQTLASRYDKRKYDGQMLAKYLNRLAGEIYDLQAKRWDSRFSPDAPTAITQLVLHHLSLEYLLHKQVPAMQATHRLSNILHSFEAFTFYPGGTPLRLRILDLQRELYAEDPAQYWHGLASKLVRLGRFNSRLISAYDAPAYIAQARDISSKHSNQDSERWTDSQVLDGHAGCVCSVAFSPDGRQIVSGSKDGTVRCWDALTGRRVGPTNRRRMGRVVDGINCVAYSPDGQLIVSGSEEGLIGRMDAVSGTVVGELWQGQIRGVSSVAFSADGEHILAGSNDGTICRWIARTGEVVGGPLTGHMGRIASLAVSPDGKLIASGSDDYCIRRWNTSTGKPIGKPLEGHRRPATSVAFSPDSQFIYSGSIDGTIRRWDADTGHLVDKLVELQGEMIYSIALSPDTKQIIAGSSQGTIHIRDAASGESIGGPLRGHGHSVWTLAFSLDGKQIVSGSEDGEVRLWDSLVDLR